MTPVRCRRCGEVLGRQGEDDFHVASLRIRTPFRWVCVWCGHGGHWRPGDRPRRPPEGEDVPREGPGELRAGGGPQP